MSKIQRGPTGLPLCPDCGKEDDHTDGTNTDHIFCMLPGWEDKDRPLTAKETRLMFDALEGRLP